MKFFVLLLILAISIECRIFSTPHFQKYRGPWALRYYRKPLNKPQIEKEKTVNSEEIDQCVLKCRNVMEKESSKNLKVESTSEDSITSRSKFGAEKETFVDDEDFVGSGYRGTDKVPFEEEYSGSGDGEIYSGDKEIRYHYKPIDEKSKNKSKREKRKFKDSDVGFGYM